MYIPTGEWHASLYGEEFNEVWFKSKDEVIENVIDGLKDHYEYTFDDYEDDIEIGFDVVKSFYIAQRYEFIPDVYVYRIIEDAKEQAWILFDNDSCGYLEQLSDETVKDLRKEMNEVFKRWQIKHNLVIWLTVFNDIEKIEVADYVGKNRRIGCKL